MTGADGASEGSLATATTASDSMTVPQHSVGSGQLLDPLIVAAEVRRSSKQSGSKQDGFGHGLSAGCGRAVHRMLLVVCLLAGRPTSRGIWKRFEFSVRCVRPWMDAVWSLHAHLDI